MNVFDNNVCQRAHQYINNYGPNRAKDDNVPTPILRLDIDLNTYSPISFDTAAAYVHKYCNNNGALGGRRRSKQQRKSRSKQQQRRRSKQQYY
jgi:hypothetical protein